MLPTEVEIYTEIQFIWLDFWLIGWLIDLWSVRIPWRLQIFSSYWGKQGDTKIRTDLNWVSISPGTPYLSPRESGFISRWVLDPRGYTRWRTGSCIIKSSQTVKPSKSFNCHARGQDQITVIHNSIRYLHKLMSIYSCGKAIPITPNFGVVGWFWPKLPFLFMWFVCLPMCTVSNLLQSKNKHQW